MNELLEAKASASTEAIRKIFNSDYVKSNYKDALIQRPGKNRIGNRSGITTSDFIDILTHVFNINATDVTILKPPSKSSKFDAFEFPTDDGVATVILAGKGAEESERQERGVITAINSVPGVKTLVFQNGTKIENVLEAGKVGSVPGYKYQAYADIQLTTKDGTIKISAKGTSAPTLGGGGLSGIDTINIPEMNEFVESFYQKAYNTYAATIKANPDLKGQNLQGNPDFPDFYEKIPESILLPLLKGTEQIGGPIDYYYTGDMDVISKVEGVTITIDGDLLTVEEFVKLKGVFYLRMGKRDGACYFTDSDNELTNITVPKILTSKPNGEGGTQTRLFVVSKVK